MRVFPRINYRRLKAKGVRRPHRPRDPTAARAESSPLLLFVPPILIIASVLAFANADPGLLFGLAVTAALYATAQSVALRRLSRRRPLQFSLQEGEDRRFLLDLGGPVLCIFEGCVYEQGAVSMQPGDVFVGYTDGVIEALDARGEVLATDCYLASHFVTRSAELGHKIDLRPGRTRRPKRLRRRVG